MFITHGKTLLAFKHYILESKPCFRNTKSSVYYIVEIQSSSENKSYFLESSWMRIFYVFAVVWQSPTIQSNHEKHLKIKSAKKDTSECSFFSCKIFKKLEFIQVEQMLAYKAVMKNFKNWHNLYALLQNNENILNLHNY